jgi:hypothetical protein
MKRGKSRRNPTGHSNNKPAPIRDRRIVLVNDGLLRKRAATEFNEAMAKLDKARAELRRFEQEDRPSFGRWMASTFGALLTELRDTTRLINEQDDLIEEVQMEMMWSNHHNPRRAYAAVMNRRKNPDPDDDFEDAAQDEAHHQDGPAGRSRDDCTRDDEGNDPDGSDPFEEMGADIPKQQRRAMFEDFLKSVLGINPKRMDKAEYAKMFAQFDADVFGKGSQANPFQIHEEKPVAGRDETRIKEIYRILVRRLHPDLRADGDAKVAAVWHEVQEAYVTRNLDRLETLLALTEMQGKNGGRASLSQMRGALEELNRSLRAIQRSIREAKRDPAWGFSKAANRTQMEKRIRRELEESLTRQRLVLANLKRTLDQWARPWNPPAKKQPKPKATRTERSKHESNVPRPVQTEFFAF